MIFFRAQQISLGEINRNLRFEKELDKFNNGPEKIKYSDIKGIPYYYPQFLKAKVGETSTTALIRYNSFLDTVELVDKVNVYQLPKDESSPNFTFEGTKEKLIFVKTEDLYSGYFFEISDGKYRILKKVVTIYIKEVPAPNSMIAATPAVFRPQKPMYFIKTENKFFKITNSKDLAKYFAEKEVEKFISKNKIKLNREEDLIKLGTFLNQ